MTTLPQTTTSRVPTRPAGPPMSIAPVPVAAPVSSAMTGGDVWRVIRANIWMILLVLMLAGIAGVALNELVFAKYFSRYTAVGWVRITPVSRPSLLTPYDVQADYGMLAVRQRTQAQYFKQDGLLFTFLKDSEEVKKTQWYQQFMLRQSDGAEKFDIGIAKDKLESSLSATALPETELIQISMTAPVAEDSRLILLELVNTHLNQQRKNMLDRESVEVADLNKLKASLNLRNNTLGEDLRRLQVDLNKGGYKTSVGGVSGKEMELMELLRSQMEKQQDLAEAQQFATSISDALSRGETPGEVDMMMNQDNRIFQKRAEADAYESSLRKFELYGKEHPRYKEIENGYNVALRQLDDAIAEFRSRMTGQLSQNAQMKVGTAQSALETLTNRISELRNELGDLDYKMVQFLTKMDERKNVEESLKIVQAKLSEKQLNRDLPSGVEWAGRPETPTSRSFPKLWMTLTAAIGLGLMLSLGLAFLREMLDTSVRSPRDIAKVGQLNMLGMIPHEDDDPQVAGVPLSMVIFQAPTSAVAEQFRQVRSRLQHAASLDTTRTILITSPSPADGKSTVAANLAAGLALNGRRILLVDANFRRPELHKMFNVSNEMGFSSVFASLDNLAQAVRPTSVPNLDVLPAGPKPANATELLESTLFTDFIDKALMDYDHVIFDSGPLLFVSETVAMAPRVDGVVTVVRASSSSRGLLQRLRDQLKQVKAEHLGVVLNAVRSQGGGYYGRNIKTYYEYSNGHKN